MTIGLGLTLHINVTALRRNTRPPFGEECLEGKLAPEVLSMSVSFVRNVSRGDGKVFLKRFRRSYHLVIFTVQVSGIDGCEVPVVSVTTSVGKGAQEGFHFPFELLR